jgi:hypothetical protein
MKSLVESLLSPADRAALQADTVAMVEQFIAKRGGLKGMAYKTGYAMLKKARPGIVERATERMLPDFLAALEPLYREFQTAPTADFAAFLQQHTGRAVRSLLGVADARAAKASDNVRRTYDKFRDGAEDEVTRLLPLFGAVLNRHLPPA